MDYQCFILLLLLGIYRSSASLPESNLCVKHNLACSSQVSHLNLSNEDCRMVYYERNSKECSSLVFDKQSHLTDLGTVRLQSYVYSTELTRQAAFNVSFMNISWTNIIIRFSQYSDPEKNSCREFHVTEKFLATRSNSLFYDCLWSRSDYEEKTYNFEYMARNYLTSEYHMYVFVVPRGDRINPIETKLSNWEVFMYIDVSDSRTVILKCQTLPKHYNVTKYLVKVYSGTIKDSVCQDERNITANEDEYEITYTWNLGIFPGNYYFTVQPLSTACNGFRCLISKSTDITINTINPLYIGCPLFAVILLGLICLYLKLKMKIFGSRDPELPEKPTLLLIYRSTHSSHIKVVVELAKYLRKHCDINAMVDELDVNNSESQNPFHWYNDAVADADFIAIVSSPTCCDSISGIYPKADEAALCLLRGNAFKREHFSKAYKLMVFMLPYGSEKHLPVEAKNIGLQYKIPNHLKQATYYIHNFREMYFFERLYYCLKGRSNFIWNLANKRKSLNKKCAWPELQAAIQEATAEVNRCVVKRDLKDAECQDIKKIFQDKSMENIKLDDPLETSCNSSEYLPQDDTKVYAEFPGLLDDLDLLGSNDEIISDNSYSKGILPLDGLRL